MQYLGAEEVMRFVGKKLVGAVSRCRSIRQGFKRLCYSVLTPLAGFANAAVREQRVGSDFLKYCARCLHKQSANTRPVLQHHRETYPIRLR